MHLSNNQQDAIINHKLTIRNYFLKHNSILEPNPNTNIFVSLKGFYKDNYKFKKPIEIATLIMLSSFNSFEQDPNKPLIAKLVSPSMVFDRFQFRTKRGKKELIINTLNTLIYNRIITVKTGNGVVNQLSMADFDILFDIEQDLITENDESVKRFFAIRWDELTTILNQSDTDINKINLLATLASIVSCFKSDQINQQAIFSGLKQQAEIVPYICIRGEISLAERIGLSRKTISPLIKELKKLGLIAYEKVRKGKNDINKWQKFYVRSENYYPLLDFIFMNLETPFGTYDPDASAELKEQYKKLEIFNIQGVLIKNISLYFVDSKYIAYSKINEKEYRIKHGQLEIKPEELELAYLEFDSAGKYTFNKQAKYDADFNLKTRKKNTPSKPMPGEEKGENVEPIQPELDPEWEEFRDYFRFEDESELELEP